MSRHFSSSKLYFYRANREYGPALYLKSQMPRRTAISLLLLLMGVAAGYAAQREYLSGTILELRQQERDRVELYIVNTAIVTPEPYYTIAIDVNGMRYEGEFLPHNPHEMLPSFWKADEKVALRIDKHFMYVKREDGSEVKFLILNKSALHAERTTH